MPNRTLSYTVRQGSRGGGQAALGVVTEFVGRDQIAEGPAIGSPHAPSDLVELREPETVGPVHDERVRVRDIEAVFDDRGADQDIDLPVDKAPHDSIQLPRRHLSVGDLDSGLGNQRSDPLGGSVDRRNEIV